MIFSLCVCVCILYMPLNWFYIIILICCLYPFVCLNYANCFLLHSIYITRLCTEAILLFIFFLLLCFIIFMQGNNIEKIRMLLQHNAHGMIQLFLLSFFFCFVSSTKETEKKFDSKESKKE